MPAQTSQFKKSTLAKAVALMGATLLPSAAASPVNIETDVVTSYDTYYYGGYSDISVFGSLGSAYYPSGTTIYYSSYEPTATATEVTPPGSNSEFAKQMLYFHNSRRALHEDTDPLGWSDYLATQAQEIVDSYDCSGNLYQGGGQYGVNLAFGMGWEQSFGLWYDEIAFYNYSEPMANPYTNRFTQIVWKDTKMFGCAYKECSWSWGYYVLCLYDPAGNVEGEFEENVLPPINPEDDGYITFPYDMTYSATATFA